MFIIEIFYLNNNENLFKKILDVYNLVINATRSIRFNIFKRIYNAKTKVNSIYYTSIFALRISRIAMKIFFNLFIRHLYSCFKIINVRFYFSTCNEIPISSFLRSEKCFLFLLNIFMNENFNQRYFKN